MEHSPSPRRAYSTDLTDDQWHKLEPLIPAPKKGGRPAKYERREILNALFYLTRNGCTWRNLPHDLPPWSLPAPRPAALVAGPLLLLALEAGRHLAEHPRPPARAGEDKERARPAALRRRAGQPIRQDDGKRGARGYDGATAPDGNKKIVGRKRNILVDTEGLLIGCLVTPADVGDREAPKSLLRRFWLTWATARPPRACCGVSG